MIFEMTMEEFLVWKEMECTSASLGNAELDMPSAESKRGDAEVASSNPANGVTNKGG